MATVTSVLRDHVTLEIRSVDRIFMHAYVPGLQTMYQVIRFLLHRGYPIPSPAALGKIGKAFVKDIERYVADNDIPFVRFGKGQCKEKVAAPYFAGARAEGRHGVVLVGVAQEKVDAWRGWRQGGSDAHPTSSSGVSRCSSTTTTSICSTPDSPSSSSAPTPPFSVWVWCNGNEWAKCQADRAGIAYSALDNGFCSCADPAHLQRICDRLGAEAIRSFVERWLRRLPSSPLSSPDGSAEEPPGASPPG